MKYTVHIDLDLPRQRVLELFDDAANLPKWQEGLESIEHLSGEAGQPGARSKLVFQMGRRKVEMIETITDRDLPDLFAGTYDAPGVHNVIQNRFIELGKERTRWESENEFAFRGMMRVVGFLMKGAFPKQSMKYLRAFKAFAEEGTDVRDA